MRNLTELQSLADTEMMLQLLIKWCEQSKSPDLMKFRSAMLRTTFYINSLQSERETFDRLIETYQNDRNRAIERSRRADETINEQQKEIDKMKQSLKAFGL
jgi:hypothetical protein